MRNQVRCAPQASAASACACWNGVGSGPTSMPSISAGMSSASARSPIASTQARVGARAALVAGHVEAARVALGVGAQRVEIGRLALVRPWRAAESSARARAAASAAASAGRAAPLARRLELPAADADDRLAAPCSASAISDSVP